MSNTIRIIFQCSLMILVFITRFLAQNVLIDQITPMRSSSHVCKYTRKRAHELGIDAVFLPIGSPDQNPIEPVWKNLKWGFSPLMFVNSEGEYRSLLNELFDQLTEKLSFAASWIDNHLGGFPNKIL